MYLLEDQYNYLKQLELLIIKRTVIRYVSLAKQIRLATPIC